MGRAPERGELRMVGQATAAAAADEKRSDTRAGTVKHQPRDKRASNAGGARAMPGGKIGAGPERGMQSGDKNGKHRGWVRNRGKSWGGATKGSCQTGGANAQRGRGKEAGGRAKKGNAEGAGGAQAARRAAVGQRQPMATRARGREGQSQQPPANNHTTRPLAHHPTAASQQQQPSNPSNNQRPRQAHISATSSEPAEQRQGAAPSRPCQGGGRGPRLGTRQPPPRGLQGKVHACRRERRRQPPARNSTPHPTVSPHVNARGHPLRAGRRHGRGGGQCPWPAPPAGPSTGPQPTARRHTTADARRGWVATPSKPSAGPSTGPHQQGDATHRAAPTGAPPSNTRSGP